MKFCFQRWPASHQTAFVGPESSSLSLAHRLCQHFFFDGPIHSSDCRTIDGAQGAAVEWCRCQTTQTRFLAPNAHQLNPFFPFSKALPVVVWHVRPNLGLLQNHARMHAHAHAHTARLWFLNGATSAPRTSTCRQHGVRAAMSSLPPFSSSTTNERPIPQLKITSSP